MFLGFDPHKSPLLEVVHNQGSYCANVSYEPSIKSGKAMIALKLMNGLRCRPLFNGSNILFIHMNFLRTDHIAEK